MRQIYLASDSKARKELLNVLGVKFKVLPSEYKQEEITGKSWPDIVKNNALKKAKDVSRRIKRGVVIAADTIVVQGKKVFGKPKDLQDARRMLELLNRKPQWLYTAVAVIDKDKNALKVDYEKTKVYMDKLSSKDIENYFARVNPLDKAGSFDIQGKGAFFIRRIEGCYYNVVGLPLRKLYRMLKELNVNILVLFLCALPFTVYTFFLSGCTTEYNVVTGHQETYFYSTDKEVQIGQSIVKEVEREYKLADDPLIQERVKDIGTKIAGVCDRKEINYYFKVLDDDEVNAVSLPGGFIYINKGLIDRIDSDDELAAVIGHEVGHIVSRHSIKKLQGVMGYSLLRVLTAVSVPQSANAGQAADIAFTELMLGYSREDELLADQLGSRYAKLAGYDPRAMIHFLERLHQINRRKPLRPRSYFKTHPYVPDRIRVVKEELGEDITFKDYINIEQNMHE